jgi:trigger factor
VQTEIAELLVELCEVSSCAPNAASVAAVLTDERPAIPAGIKRAVRQRCAFGCVICGLPLYEYDHLIPYSEVEQHHPGNIVLLCDRHHAEKTKGLLPIQAITAASRAPANAVAGESAPYSLHYSDQACEARIGSNVYVWPVLREGMMTAPLIVDDTPVVMFRMEDGHLLLTVQLFDEDTEMLVQILDNELVYSVEPWDVEFQGLELTVRAQARKIFVRMRFEPPSRVDISRGHIWRNGVEMEIWPDKFVILPGMTFISNQATNCALGIAVGDHPAIGGMCSLGSPMRAEYTKYASSEERVVRIAAQSPPPTD